ncbi:putative polygalacturonase [Quercus suber]|uniref:Polygalacturonase n=1 Tax=Quercus suber TaxID=58331 RepID=A0AAW0KIV4_QUESU
MNETKNGDLLDLVLIVTLLNCRKHSAVLTDFGPVGDGKTSNTKAFNAAIQNLSRYASDGRAQLTVPPGKWLTGSFNLTSHFTLFLHKDAVILGSQFLALNLGPYPPSYYFKKRKFNLN